MCLQVYSIICVFPLDSKLMNAKVFFSTKEVFDEVLFNIERKNEWMNPYFTDVLNRGVMTFANSHQSVGVTEVGLKPRAVWPPAQVSNRWNTLPSRLGTGDGFLAVRC